MPFVKKVRTMRDPDTKQTYEVVEIVVKPAEVRQACSAETFFFFNGELFR